MIQIAKRMEIWFFTELVKAFIDKSNTYKRLCLFCLFAFAISGCVTLPRGTGLSSTSPISDPIDKKIWLSNVEVLDPSVGVKSTVQDSLTINILEYIIEGKYFKEVNLLPGKLSEGDIILRFQFDRYQQTRSPHPAYFPAAILTATLYIWFGGPIFTDSSDLSGKLVVEDASGSIITEVSSQLNEKHGVSLWSPQYSLPSGIEARTQIVKELLDKASYKIRQKGR